MRYKHLVKGKIYTFSFGKRVRRGIYQQRYFNNMINEWCYVFKSLDGFTTYTPNAIKTEIIQ